MLVLARKVEQKIRIGKDIVITVLKVSGENVSLGIDAPDDQLILREELAKNAAVTNRKSVVASEEIEELPILAQEITRDS